LGRAWWRAAVEKHGTEFKSNQAQNRLLSEDNVYVAYSVLGMRLFVPHLETVNLASCAVTLLALVLTFYFRKAMAVTLATSASVGAVLYYLGLTDS
jgi:cadmium resistance protein CadD (predicted permease)